MDNRAIGILDSGVGGLTVWKEIVKELPFESTIYIGDSLNSPYGGKSRDEICKLSESLINFLLTKQVKLVVVACNTITVSCLEQLRNKFRIPIIGTVPVVKTAVKLSKNKKIGILSTEATAKSDYQKSLIGKFAEGFEVVNLGTNKLVPFVEKGELESNKLREVLNEELKPFREQGVDVLALGCTHFPFLRNEIGKIVGEDVEIIDSGGAIARQVKRVLANNDCFASLENKPFYSFYTTGDKEQFRVVLNRVFGKRGQKVVKSVERITIQDL